MYYYSPVIQTLLLCGTRSSNFLDAHQIIFDTVRKFYIFLELLGQFFLHAYHFLMHHQPTATTATITTTITTTTTTTIPVPLAFQLPLVFQLWTYMSRTQANPCWSQRIWIFWSRSEPGPVWGSPCKTARIRRW